MSLCLATYQRKQLRSADFFGQFFSTRCIAKKTHDLPAQKFKVRCAHASDDASEDAMMNASGLRTVRNQVRCPKSRHLADNADPVVMFCYLVTAHCLTGVTKSSDV